MLDEDVWLMHYDDSGRFTGAENLDAPYPISPYRTWRDTALAQSIPLADYLAAHPGQLRRAG